MAGRSPIQHWNYLRADSNLRGAVAFRMKDRNLDKDDIQDAIGMNSYKVRDYIDGKIPNLNNFEIVKLANFLGIEISLDIKFTDGLII